jgi:hypothetical protein
MATRTICSSLLNGELFRKRCLNFEYSPYLQSYLTYQYTQEAPQTINEATSYTFTQQNNNGLTPIANSICGRVYIVSVTYRVRRLSDNAILTNNAIASNITGHIYGVRNVGNSLQINAENAPLSYPHLGNNWFRFGNVDSGRTDRFIVIDGSLRILSITWNGQTQSINCQLLCNFKVFKDTELIYSEIRSSCPEVDLFLCPLGDKNIREIILNPFEVLFITEGGTGTSEIAEQIQFYLNSILLGGSELAQTIANLGADFVEDIIDGQPDSCILLWKFNINDFPYFHYLGQYCSNESCPQPQYTIDCQNCGCPPDTCEVTCGDKTCCYDKNGKAVEVF